MCKRGSPLSISLSISISWFFCHLIPCPLFFLSPSPRRGLVLSFLFSFLSPPSTCGPVILCPTGHCCPVFLTSILPRHICHNYLFGIVSSDVACFFLGGACGWLFWCFLPLVYFTLSLIFIFIPRPNGCTKSSPWQEDRKSTQNLVPHCLTVSLETKKALYFVPTMGRTTSQGVPRTNKTPFYFLFVCLDSNLTYLVPLRGPPLRCPQRWEQTDNKTKENCKGEQK